MNPCRTFFDVGYSLSLSSWAILLSSIGVVVDENVITVVTKSTSEAIVGNKVVVAVVDYQATAATYRLGLIIHEMDGLQNHDHKAS